MKKQDSTSSLVLTGWKPAFVLAALCSLTAVAGVSAEQAETRGESASRAESTSSFGEPICGNCHTSFPGGLVAGSEKDLIALFEIIHRPPPGR